MSRVLAFSTNQALSIITLLLFDYQSILVESQRHSQMSLSENRVITRNFLFVQSVPQSKISTVLSHKIVEIQLQSGSLREDHQGLSSLSIQSNHLTKHLGPTIFQDSLSWSFTESKSLFDFYDQSL
jgi:hypothetical protein